MKENKLSEIKKEPQCGGHYHHLQQGQCGLNRIIKMLCRYLQLFVSKKPVETPNKTRKNNSSKTISAGRQ